MQRILHAGQRPKEKLQRRDPADYSPRTIPIEYSLSDDEMSKKLSHLLRFGGLHHVGTIEFWRIKDVLQKKILALSSFVQQVEDKHDRKRGNKKRYQYCADSSGTILYLRALQGHSGRSLIDPTMQDNFTIPDEFFKYINHVRCAINLHFIINLGLIPGGQNLRNKQIFFLLVDPMGKEP